MIMMFELGIPMDLIPSWSATSGCRGFIKKAKKIHFFYTLFTVKKLLRQILEEKEMSATFLDTSQNVVQ